MYKLHETRKLYRQQEKQMRVQRTEHRGAPRPGMRRGFKGYKAPVFSGGRGVIAELFGSSGE